MNHMSLQVIVTLVIGTSLTELIHTILQDWEQQDAPLYLYLEPSIRLASFVRSHAYSHRSLFFCVRNHTFNVNPWSGKWNHWKFSPTWGCVSLQRLTTSGGWKLWYMYISLLFGSFLQILSLVLVHLEFSRGRHTSGVQFVFLLIFLLLGIVPFYSNIKKAIENQVSPKSELCPRLDRSRSC